MPKAAGAVLVVAYKNGDVGLHRLDWPNLHVGAGGCSAVGSDDARIWLTMKAKEGVLGRWLVVSMECGDLRSIECLANFAIGAKPCQYWA
jgi:hypothetical protein